MGVKKCSKCKEAKPLTAFYTHPDGYQSRCKSCCNQYDREYWARNRDHLNEYHRAYDKRKKAEDPEYLEKKRTIARRAAKKRREAMKAMIRMAKEGPCTDCGVVLPPEVMDLDHIRGEKKFNIARSYNGGEGYVSYAMLEVELAKCDPRCPNCHRMRHYKEGYLDDQGIRKSRRERTDTT